MNKFFITNLFHINWIATVALNFKTGGAAAVFHMPIRVYGKLKWHVSGSIIVPGDAIRNTLIIGSRHEDYTNFVGKAEINIEGTWKVNGVVCIGPDSFIGVRKGALLEMGNGCMFARDTQIHCSEHIVFENDIFAGELYATDSSEHQIIKGGLKQPITEEIRVGKGSYFGFRCVLLKGCKIPPLSVVASCAVCSRDYTSYGEEKLFIAGIPATVRSQDVTAVK